MIWDTIGLGGVVALTFVVAVALLWVTVAAPIMMLLWGRPNYPITGEQDWAMSRELGYGVLVLYGIGLVIGVLLALLFGIGYATRLVIA